MRISRVGRAAEFVDHRKNEANSRIKVCGRLVVVHSWLEISIGIVSTTDAIYNARFLFML